MRVHPAAISLLALVVTLAAAVAAALSLPIVAVALWLIGRILDGLDGLAARTTGRDSDVGGLLDFMFDTIGYAAVPIGLAIGVDTRAAWIVTAVLLATFYVNAVSLGYVSALLEKRGNVSERITSAVLPRGLIEGTETIVFFTLALALPTLSVWIWAVMAGSVAITAAERLRWAVRL